MPPPTSLRALLTLCAAGALLWAVALSGDAWARRVMPKTTPEQARAITEGWLNTLPAEGVTWRADRSPDAQGLYGARHGIDHASAANDPDTRFIYELPHAHDRLFIELHFHIPLSPDADLATARARFSHAVVSGWPLDSLPWVAPWSVRPVLSDAPPKVELLALSGQAVSFKVTAEATGVEATNGHCRLPQPAPPAPPIPPPPHCAFTLSRPFPITLEVTAPIFSFVPPPPPPGDMTITPLTNTGNIGHTP